MPLQIYPTGCVVFFDSCLLSRVPSISELLLGISQEVARWAGHDLKRPREANYQVRRKNEGDVWDDVIFVSQICRRLI